MSEDKKTKYQLSTREELQGRKGKYRIIKGIGYGASGETYKAARVSKGKKPKEVVIKIPKLDPNLSIAEQQDHLGRILTHSLENSVLRTFYGMLRVLQEFWILVHTRCS